MSRFFPHSLYAEDQPLARTLLTAHVLYRGFQSGAALGLFYGTSRVLVRDFRQGIRTALVGGWPAIQRSTGVGSLIGIGILAIGLPLQMAGKEEIEWKDSSWRLLESQGQLAVDDWTLAGTLVGLGSSALSRRQPAVPLGWKMVLGRGALGSTVGLLGYFIWTKTIKGPTKSPSESEDPTKRIA
jgi:hypothetical protein